MNQSGHNGYQSSMGSGNQSSYGMNQARGQQNRYQPSGYVQSHYQGIPKQGGSMSMQSNAGQSVSRAGGQSSGNAYNQHSSSMNSFTGNSSFGASQSQPVISHFGGQQSQQSQQQWQHASQPSQGATNYVQSQQPITSQYGYSNAQGASNQQYQQHAQQQQIGSFGMNSAGLQSQQSGYGATNYTSQASNNPVLQSVNYANQGTIVRNTGYSSNAQSSNAQSSMGMGMGMGAYSSNHQRF